MKIGVQILAYNTHETLDRLLEPWLKVKEDLNIKIWVGSGQFKLYKDLGYEDKNSETINLLKGKYSDKIDFLWTPGDGENESDHGTRSKSIEYFDEQDIDLLWVVDSDEFYTEFDIRKIYNWVLMNRRYDWYSINFKNLIGDTTKFIDFEVARIVWYKRNGGVKNYYFDCHFTYKNDIEYKEFKNICIPTTVANPLHFTWTNSSNSSISSKDKIYYQNHFYNDGCSFTWNDEKNEITFNEEFYKSHNLDIPKVKNLVNLVFSTARRLMYFERTVRTLIDKNPNIKDYINKVIILDDRSSNDDRSEMQKILSEFFDNDKIQLVTFNSDGYLDYIDKLNFIEKVCDDIEYILFLEDDWESTSEINIKEHIIEMNNNNNLDIISFSEIFWLQDEHIKVNSVINDEYWKNPFPNYFKHTYKIENDVIHWSDVGINNFTLNPSLIKKNVFFNSKFKKVRNYEFEFAEKNSFKQYFTRNCRFRHIGDDPLELFKVKVHGVDYIFDVKNNSEIKNFEWFINAISTQSWENDTFDAFNKVKNPDKIAIDIGGWIGATSIWLSKKFKHVIIVEPDKIALKALKSNLHTSESANTTIIQNPIYNKSDVELYFGTNLNNDDDFGVSTSQLRDTKVKENDESVKTTTLDNILKITGKDNVSFIKVDIEGGEENIIEDIFEACIENKYSLWLSFHYDWWKNKDIRRFDNLFSKCKNNLDISEYVINNPFCSILFEF